MNSSQPKSSPGIFRSTLPPSSTIPPTYLSQSHHHHHPISPTLPHQSTCQHRPSHATPTSSPSPPPLPLLSPPSTSLRTPLSRLPSPPQPHPHPNPPPPIIDMKNRYADPLFALFIGLSAATLRIRREEVEKGRSAEESVSSLLRYVGLVLVWRVFFLMGAGMVGCGMGVVGLGGLWGL